MGSLTGRPRKRLSQKQLRQLLRTARRQQARKARVARRRIQRIHDQLPKQVRTIFDPLEPAFSRPIHRRFVLLALAAILTLGGRTITNLLRVLGILAPGHPSSYHRVSRATAGRCRPWHAVMLRRSSPASSRLALFSWPVTTRSPNIPVRTSTARAAIAIRSAPLTPTPRFAGDISGWS